MAATGIGPEAFEFYRGLVADNTKAYWTAHKETYERAVCGPMHALLEELAPQYGGEVALFRPYRDVRFSKDKSPYKTAQGGFVAIAPGVGYHLSVGADGISIGGGFHAHDRAQTARYRAAVDDPGSGGELATMVAKLDRHGFEIGGQQVPTRPRGVPADHPRLDLIRREYLTAGRNLPPEPLTGAQLRKAVRSDWTRLRPLIAWLATHAPPT
jgi:uncharacterized protein (TIGR02453 family)